jgi:hypothetical protein
VALQDDMGDDLYTWFAYRNSTRAFDTSVATAMPCCNSPSTLLCYGRETLSLFDSRIRVPGE